MHGTINIKSLSDVLSLSIIPSILSTLQHNLEDYMYIQTDRHTLYPTNNDSMVLDAVVKILGFVLEFESY